MGSQSFESQLDKRNKNPLSLSLSCWRRLTIDIAKSGQRLHETQCLQVGWIAQQLGAMRTRKEGKTSRVRAPFEPDKTGARCSRSLPSAVPPFDEFIMERSHKGKWDVNQLSSLPNPFESSLDSGSRSLIGAWMLDRQRSFEGLRFFRLSRGRFQLPPASKTVLPGLGESS